MSESSTNILLVEDDQAHVDLVMRGFEGYSDKFTLRVANSLAEAHTSIKLGLVDLVITDLILPDGRGTELIPADGVEPLVGVVIMTSHGDEQVAVESMKAGALDYVVKSVVTLTKMPHIAERAARQWRNVVERKRAEAALKESNLRLEEALGELRMTQEKAIIQERLAAVGQMAAGISHDFNNTLMSIILYCEILLGETDLDAKAREWLEIVLGQAQHAANLTQQIMDFSRQSLINLQSVDMTSMLGKLKKLIRRTLPENIDIRLAYGSEDYVINGDPSRIVQVLMNLALNARDAMPEGGVLGYELNLVRIRPGDVVPYHELTPGEWVELSVSDSGTGIPPEYMSRIFEPFFTTKEVGKGSGLGLAQVYGIVRQHDGFIDIRSKVGQGTTFYVYLPALPAPPEIDNSPLQRQMFQGSQETLLVVEDNSATRRAVRDILEMLNYRVVTAENGQEALDLYKENQISLVLSDLVMPGMGGRELYKELRNLEPSVKMVYMTGYPPLDKGKDIGEDGVITWVQKPVSMEQISKVVKDALVHNRISD